jgi:AraC-like DNA-binding protein
MVHACESLGLDTTQILRAAKLDRATLEDPDARIPVEQIGLLWRQAYELSKDPNLALHAIEVLPFGAYRVIDFLGASAPTIGAALTKVSDYFPIINSLVHLPYETGDRQVTFGVEAPSRPEIITRPYAEYTLAAIFLRTRIVTNQKFALIRVDFSHPRPADISEHERIFECPVHFGADACRLVMTREAWDTPCAGSEATLFSVLDAHARMLIDQVPNANDIVAQVRKAIEAELRGGDPKLETVARQLAMSPRTLQRRLRDQGVMFNDILDEMRFRAAKSYLAQRDVAGTEVAYLLGFAEQSSFNHAFKRWAGLTPTEYRRQVAIQ